MVGNFQSLFYMR